MCTGSDTGYKHTFQHTVGFAFHHGTIHECARIPFVAVADDIFNLFGLTEHLRPFTAGGESAAPSATQAGVCDFIHDLLGSHIK